MPVRVRRGTADLGRLLGALSGSRITVGVHSDARRRDGTSVAEIAELHELGIGVPRRSWLRDYVDQNPDRILSIIRKAAESVMQGRRTRQQALDWIGTTIAADMRLRIYDQRIGGPPLAPATVARKGHDTKLLQTSQLANSITYKVVQ